MSTPTHHVLSVLVENQAGVLARVASLFARRGYNIFSLALARTDYVRLSRITIVVDVESAPLEQVTKQLDKLVNVVQITELDPRRSVERELLLATVSAGGERRGQIVDLVQIFDAKILSVGRDSLQNDCSLLRTDEPATLEQLRKWGALVEGDVPTGS